MSAYTIYDDFESYGYLVHETHWIYRYITVEGLRMFELAIKSFSFDF